MVAVGGAEDGIDGNELESTCIFLEPTGRKKIQ
jgi:hypothetical protein